MGAIPSLSLVTVCMNRREHLMRSAAAVAAWPHHQEHLVVDWSSEQPLRRSDLPPDGRLRLLRVEGEKRWNPSRAYNFALAQACGDQLMRMDADCWPTAGFDPEALLAAGPLWVGNGGEGRYGQFLMTRELFEAVGGFNECMRGWGFEDKDLRGRLGFQQGWSLAEIPAAAIGVITHSNEERMGQPKANGSGSLRHSLGLATMRASRLGNRLVAAHCPWGAASGRCRYQELQPGLWRLEPGSLPKPPADSADEMDHARRMAFWGCFLAIPDIFLERLPIKLVPLDRHGIWPVRWWHRLHWHTVRRLLELPVWLLSLGRGRLQGMKRAAGRPT